MKRFLFAIFLLAAGSTFAQVSGPDNQAQRAAASKAFLEGKYALGDTITGTSYAFVVLKAGAPIRVYAKVEDCLEYCHNKDLAWQQINYHYKELRDDTITWKPTMEMIMEENRFPEPLTDKWLVVKNIYVVITTRFGFADRAYATPAECEKYIGDSAYHKYAELPYYYRDKRSYQELARRARVRLGIE